MTLLTVSTTHTDGRGQTRPEVFPATADGRRAADALASRLITRPEVSAVTVSPTERIAQGSERCLGGPRLTV